MSELAPISTLRDDEAKVWLEAALFYQEQARAMREALWRVIHTAAHRDEHFAYAAELIEARFGEETGEHE